MTSVVYHRKTHSLYTDSRVTVDSVIVSDNTQKIFVLRDSTMLVGITGGLDICMSVVEQLRKTDEVVAPEKNYALIVLTREAVSIFSSESKRLVDTPIIDNLYDVSGTEILIGASVFTDDPVELMRAIIKKDSASGGEIQHGYFNSDGKATTELVV